MNPANNSPSGGSEPSPSARESDPPPDKTPNTDMQPEDAGTVESGNDSRGSAAEGAMKQTSKTDAETRGNR